MAKSETRLRAFGRPCHIVVDDREGEGNALLTACESELARLEQKFSAFHPESIVSQLNQCAGTGSYTPLDAESRSLFQFVNALWQESKRQFDPTIRVLRDCFDENGKQRASKGQLQGMLKLVGWGNVEVTDAGAHMAHQGMLVDLNSCIRPYALDCLRKVLLKDGAESAFIEFGSDAVSIGKQPDGANWLVGARAPQGSRGAIFRLKLNNKGFAVRGDFEQTTQMNDEIFGRALSPVDGLPIPGLLSVVVIADNCLSACSAASIARHKTEAAGIKWLESLGLPWMAVDRELTCHGPLAQT